MKIVTLSYKIMSDQFYIMHIVGVIILNFIIFNK